MSRRRAADVREQLTWRLLMALPQGLLIRPFELLIGTACVLTGVPLLVGAPAPTSIEALLPTWLVRVWSVELIVGGGLVAVGVFVPRTRTERIGHSLLGPAAFVYGLSILLILRDRGAVAGFIILGLGVSASLRALVLRMAERVIAQTTAAELRE